MDNGSMDKNMIQNGPEKVKKNHYTKKDIRTAYIVLFIIFFSFLVLGFFMYKAMVPISWSRF